VEPCKQEENITKLFTFHDDKVKKLQEIEVRQVEIQGDVRHIKSRIDNGMSRTIEGIKQTLTSLEPTIGHHADIVKRIETLGWTLATTLLLVMIGTIGWAVSYGFKINV
jgi:hypothetical protein